MNEPKVVLVDWMVKGGGDRAKMRIVVCHPDDIAPWIYPSAMPEYPDAGAGADFPLMDETDFAALAKVLGLHDVSPAPFDYPSSGCDVGFPHDAPDAVPQIKPIIVKSLAAIPVHERWRVAEQWANARLNKRASKEELTRHKKLLKTLCEYAELAIAQVRIMVLVEPRE